MQAKKPNSLRCTQLAADVPNTMNKELLTEILEDVQGMLIIRAGQHKARCAVCSRCGIKQYGVCVLLVDCAVLSLALMVSVHG